MHPSRPGSDKRAFGRRPTFDHAIVRIPGRPPVRCTIKNISAGGALLDFGEEIWLPYNFPLSWEVGSREEACEVKHRNGQYVGVNFLRETEAAIDRRSSSLGVDDISPWIAENTHPKR